MISRMRKILPWIALAGAAAALGACNSGSSNPPTPSGPCTLPSGTQVALVYPASGSTGITGTFGQVVIASTQSLGSNWNVVLTDAINPGGVPGGNFTTVTPPFPSPNATPSFANPVYESSSFSGLTFAASQVISVYLNNTSTNCNPLSTPAIGSFST